MKKSLDVTITKKLNLEDTAYAKMTWKSGCILIQNKKVNYHFFLFVSDHQELGLQQQYISDKGTYAYLRKIMALAFLPE